MWKIITREAWNRKHWLPSGLCSLSSQRSLKIDNELQAAPSQASNPMIWSKRNQFYSLNQVQVGQCIASTHNRPRPQKHKHHRQHTDSPHQGTRETGARINLGLIPENKTLYCKDRGMQFLKILSNKWSHRGGKSVIFLISGSYSKTLSFKQISPCHKRSLAPPPHRVFTV